MTKHRTLKAVGFFFVLAAVLAFLALPKSQAGAGKPIRWKATFEPVINANLIGSGEFVGGVNHVNINNGSGSNDTPCSATGTSGSYSYLELQVFTPSLQFINMSGFSGDSGLPSSYGFPNTKADWPHCVEDFLNNNLHPTEEYAHIILRFTTCGCGNTKTDLMAMTDGEILPVHMMFLFFTHNWYTLPKSSTPYPYLNLMMNAHGYLKTDATHPDIYIKKEGNVWTAYVDTEFGNSFYPPENLVGYNSNDWPTTKSDGILGQYATYGSSQVGGKGKTTWTTTYHYPWAKAPLKFQIAFTKY